MSNRVIIFDTTLRDGEQSPGCTMNHREKLHLARQLEALGVDVIEAGFPAASVGDFESVQAVAATVKDAQVAGLARATKGDIDRAWEAVKGGANPRIHTFIATSPLHMERKLGMLPDKVVEVAEAAVRRAAGYTSNVEFSAEDASRSEPAFLARIFERVIAAGATTINVPDTVGYTQPAEYAALFRYLLENVPNADRAIWSVHCHDDLGLAVANTLAGIGAGARQAEVTLAGIGERAGNAALEEVVMALGTRADHYGLTTGVRGEQLYPACRVLSRIIGQPIPNNKAVIGTNAFAHESGIHQDGVLKHRETYEIMTPQSVGRQGNLMVLGKHSGRHALQNKLEELGYTLDADKLVIVTDAIKRLADKKHQIFDEDVEAVVLEEVFRIPDKYKLKYIHVQSGNVAVPPTAAVVLEVDGEECKLAGFGDGPVDAVFLTISKLIGRETELVEYLVAAITGGTDAQGEVTVRIRESGHTAVGRGADADIIVASAKAYLNALNRLARRENDDLRETPTP